MRMDVTPESTLENKKAAGTRIRTGTLHDIAKLNRYTSPPYKQSAWEVLIKATEGHPPPSSLLPRQLHYKYSPYFFFLQ